LKLTVIGREHCHLCEEMVAALKDLQGRVAFELEVIDLGRHPQLEGRWGEWVPVLLEGEAEICHYCLDRAALDAHLARMA
jgi:thioredoxin reductase (NADPH)